MKLWLRLTLITMTVGGGFNGFVQTFWALVNPENQQPVYIVIMMVFLALYAFVTTSGLLFVQNPLLTFPLRLALWLQVPFVSSPFVIYQFISGFHFTVSIVGGYLSADSWLGSGWTFYFFQKVPWGFGVNLFATLMLALLERSMKAPNATVSSMPYTTGVSRVPHTFIEEIDKIVQRRLARSNMHDHSVHLYSQTDGSIEIAVNNRIYREVNAVEDTVIRDLIQRAIDEWQNENK